MYCRQPRSQRQGVHANAVGVQQRVGTDVKCIRVGLDERVERRCDVLRPSHFGYSDLKAKLAGRCLGFAHLRQGGGIVGIRQDRQSAQTGHNFTQELEFLPTGIRYLIRQAGDVARVVAPDSPPSQSLRDPSRPRTQSG